MLRAARARRLGLAFGSLQQQRERAKRRLKPHSGAVLITEDLLVGDDLAQMRVHGLLERDLEDSEIPPDSAWEKLWEGRRRGDDTERFILFRRTSTAPPRPGTS